jgi:exosortase K
VEPGVKTAMVGALSLLAAFALKHAYSTAGADQLAWVLAPSCWLASHAGLSLTHEPGAGFISHMPRMVVGPPCAGLNFMVVAWLALYWCAQARFGGARAKLGWLLASGLAAYLATIATNGARIVLAAQLFDATFYTGMITKARVHRLLGVGLYCSVLLVACHAAQRATRAAAAHPLQRLAPLAWYVAVVLVVPLANRAFLRGPERFAEHALSTLAVVVLVAGLAAGLRWLVARPRDRICSPRSPA